MKNKILLLIFPLILLACACETLEPITDYCEVAFAYPMEQDLPGELDKNLIGCACTIKDILKGKEVGEWKLYPLEKCRRVRGFHPKIWKETIDPYFQYQSQKLKKK